MSDPAKYRAWVDEMWFALYFERGRPIDPQLKEHNRVCLLPTTIMRGLCLYIQCSVVMAFMLQELFRGLEQGHFMSRILRRRLSDRIRFTVTQEVASYVLFEATKQVWNYGPGGKSRDGAQETLDTIWYWFASSYNVAVRDKIQDYQQSENALRTLGRAIGDALGDPDLQKEMKAVVPVAAGFEALIDGIERMYALTEQEMTEIIQDYFNNAWDSMQIRKSW